MDSSFPPIQEPQAGEVVLAQKLETGQEMSCAFCASLVYRDERRSAKIFIYIICAFNICVHYP